MRAYDLLPSAQDDILELVERAAEYSPEARDRLTDRLFDTFERLADFPYMGKERLEVAPGLRSFPINKLKVTVYYVVGEAETDTILIFRVLRQERDVGPEDLKT